MSTADVGAGCDTGPLGWGTGGASKPVCVIEEKRSVFERECVRVCLRERVCVCVKMRECVCENEREEEKRVCV